METIKLAITGIGDSQETIKKRGQPLCPSVRVVNPSLPDRNRSIQKEADLHLGIFAYHGLQAVACKLLFWGRVSR
jgi:hypothetical protein